MARDTWLDDLAQIPFFAGCSTKELQLISAASVELSVVAGQVLVREGEAGHESFVIISGSATVTRDGQTIGPLEAGDIVGELSLLTGAPRVASVVADTDMTVRVIGSREFGPLLDEIPGLAVRILRNLATRMVEFEEAAFLKES